MSESLRNAKAVDFNKDEASSVLVRVDVGKGEKSFPVFLDRSRIEFIQSAAGDVNQSSTIIGMRSGNFINVDMPYDKVLTILGFSDMTQLYNSVTSTPEDLRR